LIDNNARLGIIGDYHGLARYRGAGRRCDGAHGGEHRHHAGHRAELWIAAGDRPRGGAAAAKGAITPEAIEAELYTADLPRSTC
jgi:undecaprenyl diphosphate synthase